jgi:hypothetical protein
LPFIEEEGAEVNPFPKLARVAAAFAASLTFVSATTAVASAAGLPNCAQTGVAPCFETVWTGGSQHYMTFANLAFPLTTSAPTGAFYVVAPQTSVPQGTVPFLHDHIVVASPAQNGGTYTVHSHGFLVFCSAQGFSTGACQPEGGDTPLAKTVNGQMLTTVEAVESNVDAGLLQLLDTNAVLIGTINSSR